MNQNPTTLGEWVISGGMILGFVWIIVQWVQSSRRTPPIEAEFATKKEVNELANRLGSAIDNIRQQITGAITRAEFETFKSQVMLQLGETQAIVTQQGKATLEAIYQMRTDLATADERRATRIHDRLNEAERELHILQGQVSRDDTA